MAARGAKINWTTGGTACYMRHLASLANGVPVSTGPMTVCGWINVRGDQGGTDGDGHFLCDFRTDGDGGVLVIRAIDADNSFQHAPWSYRCTPIDGSPLYAGHDINATADAVQNNDNWFYAAVFDGVNTVTFYYVKDGGTIASAAFSPITWLTSQNFDQFTVFSNFHGGNCEVTEVRVFIGALTSGQVDAERKSPTPVYSINPSILWAYYKLNNGSDTADYSGNNRTLTSFGTITDGTMDPVDIRSISTVSGGLVFGGLSIKH